MARRRRLADSYEEDVRIVRGRRRPRGDLDGLDGLPLGTIAIGAAILLLITTGGKAIMTWKTKKEFIRMIDGVMQEMGISQELRLAIIAHAGVETAMGTSGTAVKGNNFWNFSTGSSWTGPYVLGGDKEPDGAGGWKPIVQKWRAWPDVASAVRGWLEFLSRSTPIKGFSVSYADALEEAKVGDYRAFTEKLRAAGYFTWPIDDFRDETGFHYGYWSMFKGQLNLAASTLGLS